MRVKLAALWSAVVLIILLALLGVSRSLFGADVDWEFGITALVMWWMTLAIAAAGAVLAAGRLRFAMLLCIALAATLVGLLLFDIEEGPDWLLWAVWFGAAALAQAGLLIHFPLRTRPARIVRAVTLLCLALFVAAMFPKISDLFDFDVPSSDTFERGILAASLLNAAGTLLVLAFLGIESRQPPAPESIPANVTLAAICPRCGAANTFPTGRSECRSCGLRITLDIEEPRCACGYLLYKLDSDKCPECGRLIRRRPDPAAQV